MADLRLHLLFIVNSLQVGGAERHVVSLVNGLDPERIRVSLVCLKPDVSLLAQVRPQRLEGRLFHVDVRHRLDLSAALRIARHIDAEGVDVVVCTNTYPLLYGWLARHCLRLTASRCRPRLVEVFHTTDPGPLRERLQMAFYRPFFACADMLVYVSRLQREFWRGKALRACREAVIWNGVDLRHFVPSGFVDEGLAMRERFGFGASDYVVGLCAAMRPEKMHQDLIEAVAALHGEGLPVRCLLIGDGPRREAIEASIRNAGMERFIRITGMMDDVRPSIAACDVMTLVSHHVDTFSIAALEAMAMGKAMVMSDVGGASEQIRDGVSGYLYPRGDIGALAQRLRALADPAARENMGEAARLAVRRHFALDAMLREYEDMFIDLVQPDVDRSAFHAG
jgi:glycosyltransferase involved in cell wall biosynthesis